MTLLPTQNPPRRRLFYLLPALLLTAVTLLVYWPAIRGGFIWDDPDYVVNNGTLRSVDGLWQIWTQPSASPQYYPLVFTSFWVEYHLWQLAPLGYHFDNVLLHLAAALLIWRLCEQLGIRGGLLAAAIFALHPVCVESAAWISERKNVLSAALYLSAMLVFLQRDRGRSYSLSLLLFIAALMSKSVTASWPAALLLILWWRDGSVTRGVLRKLIPFFVIGAASLAFTAHLERTHVGTDQIAELQFTAAQRVLLASHAIGFYAGKLFWPHPLSFIYSEWSLDVHQWRPWIFVVGIAGLFVVLAWVAKRSRWPLATALLFVGTLAPALGIVSVYPMRYALAADHFQYLASAFLIVPISAIGWRFVGRASLLLVIPLAWLSVQRAAAFHDSESLWRDTLTKNPNSWMVNTNLANALVERNDMQEAATLYLRALALAPQLYETHANAGIAYSILARYDDAIAELKIATKMNRAFAPAYFAWGQLLQQQGQNVEAIEKYRVAVQLRPDYGKAWMRLAYLLEKTDPSAAADAYERVLQLDPSNREARSALDRLDQK